MATALNEHSEAKDGRYRKHTESLVRVRLTRDNPGKIAIFKDDRASRWYSLYLQALTVAQFKEQAKGARSEAAPEEKSIAPPIYYYLPDSLKCFSDYTAAKQAADRKAAKAINSNENILVEKLRNEAFWFLMGLPKESLTARLNSELVVEGVDMLVLSYLMLTGYVGLARGLAKLAGINASEEKYWAPFKPPVVGSEEKESDSHPLLAQAHPQFIDQAALHFPEQYTQLNSRLLEVKDSEGDTALITAARLGFPKRVEALLAHSKININPRNRRGSTPLHLAAKWGYVAVVQALLAVGSIGVNAQDNLRETPLHCAAQYGHVEVVQALIQKDANINAANKLGDTPLHEAVRNRCVAVVQALLAVGSIEVNARDRSNRSTPLHLAALMGHVEVVQALIQKGANINAKNKNDRTPLHLAAFKGHVDIVNVLLAVGSIEVNARDRSNRSTPLHWAAFEGHVDIVNVLLAVDSIEVNARDRSNRSTPLHWAAREGHVDVVQALIQKGANINAKENDDYTPLHWAAFEGHVDVVNALLGARNIQVNARDRSNRSTPLHWAAQRGHGDVVNALLNRQDIDLNAKDNDGDTPLNLVFQGGHSDLVNALFKLTDEKQDFNLKKALLKGDQQGKLFQGAILIERSAVVVGAVLSGILFAEASSPKGWIDTLSQALQSQVGSALCAAVLLAGCMAACRQLFYLRTRADYAQATCGQQAVIVGGKFLMTGAAATLFTAAAFPQTGLMTLCNSPLTAGMVLGAVCLIGVAGYLSDRTYTTVISGG
jgi:ankyrin repeat protein